MPVTLWGRLGRLWGGGVSESLYGQYHAVLGGVGLILQNGGYERRVAQAYASKLATGGLSQADQLQNQTVLLDDWSGGEGGLRQASSGGVYRRGSGIDVYSEPGAVGMGPQSVLEWTSTEDSLLTVAAVQGNLFMGSGNGKIYRWISTSTAAPALSLNSSKAGGITSLLRLGTDAAFAGNGSDGVVYMYTGSSGWQPHFTLSGTVTGCHAMASHWKGGARRFYFAADRAGNAAVIHYSADGSSATPTAAFALDEPRVDVMMAKRTNLVVVGTDHTHRRSSIYTIDDSSNLAGGFEHKLSVEGIVLQCAAVEGDNMYLGDKYGGRIWRWDGTDLTLVHRLGTEQDPYTGEIRGMWTYRGAMWASIVDEDGTIGLIRRDPDTDGWSRPVTGLAGTTPEQLAEFQGELAVLTSATAASKLYTVNPDAYTSSGSVESGLIDASLGGTGKQWLGVTVVHSSLAATQSVEVQYKADDEGSWTSLGTSDTDGATEKTFDFAAPITAQTIAFKMVLTGTAGSTTPLKVYSLAARWLPSPGVKREWSLRVRLEGAGTRRMTGANGTALTETGEQISAGLWALVDAAAPVTYLDVDREEYTVRLVEYSEGLANLSNAGAMTNGWDLAGSLRIVEQ